jgi:hypothetical protein
LALLDLFDKCKMVVGLSRSFFSRWRGALLVSARWSIAPFAASFLVAVPTGSLVPARFAVPTTASSPATIRTLAIMSSFLLARGTLRWNGCRSRRALGARSRRRRNRRPDWLARRHRCNSGFRRNFDPQ